MAASALALASASSSLCLVSSSAMAASYFVLASASAASVLAVDSELSDTCCEDAAFAAFRAAASASLASSSSASSLDTLERSASSCRSCDLHSFSAAARSCFWLFSSTEMRSLSPSHSVRSAFSSAMAESSSAPKSSSGSPPAGFFRRFSIAGRTRCARSASSLWTIEVPSPTRPSAMSFSAARLLKGPVRFPWLSSRYQTMSSSSREGAGIQFFLSREISFPGWTRPCSAHRRSALVGTGPKTTPLAIRKNQLLVSVSSSLIRVSCLFLFAWVSLLYHNL